MSTSSFKNVTLAILVLGSSAAGCRDGGYPEGVYPCATPADCPPAWFCHSDNLCWSAPESDAGLDSGPRDAGEHDAFAVPDAAAADVGTVDAAPVDAALEDVGVDAGVCVSAPETCNGVDDDCDGTFDEGVVEFSPPVAGVASLTASEPDVAGGETARGIGYEDSDQYWWQPILVDGRPSGSALPLGLDTAGFFRTDFAFDGTRMLLAGIQGSVTQIIGFDPTTGSRSLASFTIPTSGSRMPLGPVRISGTSSNRAAVFVAERDGTIRMVRRYRLNTAGGAPTVVAQADVTRTLSTTALNSVWDSESTALNDLVVYRSSSDALVLAAGPPGDDSGAFAEIGRLASGVTSVARVALALFEPLQPVSADNPLLVVTQSATGMTHYLVDRLVPFHFVGPTTVAGALGFVTTGLAPGATLDVIAMPRSSHSRWLILAMQDDGPVTTDDSSVVGAWEIFGTDHAVRGVPITAAIEQRSQVRLSVEGATVRAVYVDDRSIATAVLGCGP